MQSSMRSICIDVCDYSNRPLCNLYDSTRNVSGQATEVFIHCERNGFKELKFNLPSTCFTDEGEEKNYRLNYLINDYRIKFQVYSPALNRIETDWFLVSETRVTHQAFSQNYEIRAGHISQLLKTKKLDIEFSDNEGNNVGTIGEIAATILEGTGWHLGEVAKFEEEKKFNQLQGTEKVRSFTASIQTGAFKMMSDLCELFDAKPIYHGESAYEVYDIQGYDTNNNLSIYLHECDNHDANKAIINATAEGWTDLEIIDLGTKLGKTVDIVPMNPFSEDTEEGSIPSNIINDKILELHYDKNVKDVTRTLNTENLVTKLSAYGSYGDRNGLCSLQRAKHIVIHLPDVEAGQEYKFVYNNANYFFTPDNNDTGLKWSYLDFVSRMYVFNDEHTYKVYKEAQTDTYETIELDVSDMTEEVNYFPFIMDFSYYQKIGLLTDEMLNYLAYYQKTLPQLYINAEAASVAMSDVKTQLFETASASNGFLKLDIDYAEVNNNQSSVNYNQLVLHLNKREYSDGVIYRSDYDEAKRNYFSWNVASGIKQKGEAIAGEGSVIYIVRQGEPTQWTKAYIKMIGDDTNNFFFDNLGTYYNLSVREAHQRKELVDTNDDIFPSSGEEGIVYVAEDTGKMYVWNGTDYTEIFAANYTYGMNNFNEPASITLWCQENVWQSGDIIYLFAADSIAGLFGPREDEIYANRESIEKSTQVATVVHPIYFVADNQAAPALTSALQSYGWYYRYYTSNPNKYSFGDLYFCYGTRNEGAWDKTHPYLPNDEGDIDWIKVYISKGNEDPEKNPAVSTVSDYGYYYHIRRQMLYRAYFDQWIPLDTDVLDNKNVLNAFKSVVNGCIKQEVLTKGVGEQYYYFVEEKDLVNNVFPIGNYAFRNEFDIYYYFTTDIELAYNNKIRYDTATKKVWQNDDEHYVLSAIESTSDLLDFPLSNELYNAFFQKGNYSNNTIEYTEGGNKWISNNIPVHEGIKYECSLPIGFTIVFRDASNGILSEATVNNFVTPNHTENIVIVCPDSVTNPITDSDYVRVKNYDNCFFVKDKQYTILANDSTHITDSSGDRKGIYYLMDKFIELSDEAYLEYLPALQTAQNKITQENLNLMELLGDMYREGYWQQNDYVEGDEDKLYLDALDNLKEISHPEATYEVGYLDLYPSDKHIGLSVDESTENIDYPEIDISFAAHLVDPEIDTNCWAYIDSTDTCYDQPQKSTIEINTRLSMIGQQSFTDVLSHIAEVANETRANQTIYKRAAALGSDGSLATDRLEGALEAGKVYLLGGTSNWHTDSKGNIIFEAADQSSAMMLTGRGLMISHEKDEYDDWIWRTAITGQGMTADAIYTGYLSGDRIEAGSITANKLSSSVGSQLEISSNVALSLFATTDGRKPSGSVNVKDISTNASIIEIAAGGTETGELAHINILTGGYLNLGSGGNLNIESGGVINIKANSEFLVDSPHFKIINDSNNDHAVIVEGTITAHSGSIGGFDIGEQYYYNMFEYGYIRYGNVTISHTSPDKLYIGTNGINFGGKFIYAKDIQTDTYHMSITADTIDIKQTDSQSGTQTTTFSVANGNMTINAAANIALTASGSINIASNTLLALTTNGTISIGKTGSLFTIGGDSNNAYIYNGKSSLTDVSHNGVYIGTNGIAIGQYTNSSLAYENAFSVTSEGVLTANNATIRGTIYATNGEFSGTLYASNGTIANWYIQPGFVADSQTLLQSTVGFGDSTYAFWAGHPYTAGQSLQGLNQSVFWVANTGEVQASNLNITGGSITITDPSTNLVTFSVANNGAATASNLHITGGSISIFKNNEPVFEVTQQGSVSITGDGTFDVDTENFTVSSEDRLFQTGNWKFTDDGMSFLHTVSYEEEGVTISGDTTFRIEYSEISPQNDLNCGIKYSHEWGKVGTPWDKQIEIDGIDWHGKFVPKLTLYGTPGEIFRENTSYSPTCELNIRFDSVMTRQYGLLSPDFTERYQKEIDISPDSNSKAYLGKNQLFEDIYFRDAAGHPCSVQQIPYKSESGWDDEEQKIYTFPNGFMVITIKKLFDVDITSTSGSIYWTSIDAQQFDEEFQEPPHVFVCTHQGTTNAWVWGRSHPTTTTTGSVFVARGNKAEDKTLWVEWLAVGWKKGYGYSFF